MKDTLTRYIGEHLLSGRGEQEISAETELLASGLLNSLGVMQLIWFIEEQLGVTVPPADVTIENFQSVDTIAGYLETLSEG